MDTKLEFAQIDTNEEVTMHALSPLSELQLALVGGGCGDVIFA